MFSGCDSSSGFWIHNQTDLYSIEVGWIFDIFQFFCHHQTAHTTGLLHLWIINWWKLPYWSLDCYARLLRLPFNIKTSYILLFISLISQIECTSRLPWWELVSGKHHNRKDCWVKQCGLLSTLQQRGQRFDSFSRHTLWLWIHTLEMPALYM